MINGAVSSFVYICDSIKNNPDFVNNPNNDINHLFCIHSNPGNTSQEICKSISILPSVLHESGIMTCSRNNEMLCINCLSHIDSKTGKCQGCGTVYCL
jgi:hypothetical protein